MSRAVSTVIVGLLSTLLLWAGQPWQGKPYTKWTVKDVERVLQNSPWVRKQWVGNVRPWDLSPDAKPVNTAGLTKGQAENVATYSEHAGPVSRGPVTEGRPEDAPSDTRTREAQAVKPRGRLTVRWFSARTVGEGLIRQWQLQLEKLPQPEDVTKTLQRKIPESADDPWYVERVTQKLRQRRVALLQNIERMQSRLAGSHPYYEIVVNPVSLSESDRQDLEEASYLQPEESRERIPLAHTEVSGRSVVFYFPRQIEGRPTIASGEKKIRFYTRIVDQEVKVDFDLRRMVRDGKPDL